MDKDNPARNLKNPTFQGYKILHIAFTIVPLIAGADKLFGLTTDWNRYLNPAIPAALGLESQTFMYAVGIVEVLAGMITALAPQIGGYLVAIWFLAIIVNLLSMGSYYDIVLRDFGLMFSALALARLALVFHSKENY